MILDGLVRGPCPRRPSHLVSVCRWFQAGHRSVEPAHSFALKRLGLEPLLDYGFRLGEGTGAVLALPILRAAQATLTDMATFAEAGVSEQSADE